MLAAQQLLCELDSRVQILHDRGLEGAGPRFHRIVLDRSILGVSLFLSLVYLPDQLFDVLIERLMGAAHSVTVALYCLIKFSAVINSLTYLFKADESGFLTVGL